MNNEEWKGFFTWLDTASVDELRRRDEALEELIQMLRSADVRTDARRMRRHIERELLARLNQPES